MKKSMVLFLTICLFVCLLPCPAQAASTGDANEPIDTSAEGTLTVNYAHGEKAFSGLSVQLYRVAAVSADFQYTLTDAFLNTRLMLNGITSTNEWDAVRTTLESHIASNAVVPVKTAVTNASGSVRFGELVPGLYFVLPLQFIEDGACYYYASALIAVPGLDGQGHWQYDVTVTPKPAVDVPTGGSKEHKVVKLWRDSGNTAKRPTSVTVDIFCNGKVIETVTLSAANSWSYTWTAADNGDVWQVAEKDVPDGYTMTLEQHLTTFNIINTVPGTPSSPKTGDSSNIGLYVLLMCASGLSLVLLAATAKRKEKE